MDGIQTYAAHATARPALATTPAAAASNPAAVKTPSDYIRALKRRVWLVLMVGVPLSILASVYVMRQPSIYRATAMISVEPPQYDPALEALVSHAVSHQDRDVSEHYLPNRVAYLKSKGLAQKVVNDPAFLQADLPPDSDAADVLIENLVTKIHLNSNWVTVTLDGTDKSRTAKQLQTLLTKFADEAKFDAQARNDFTRENASASLTRLENELRRVEQRLTAMLASTTTIGPGGKNIVQAQFESADVILMHKRVKLDDFQQQAWVSELFPKFDKNMRPEDAKRLDQIDKMQETRRKLLEKLQESRRLTRSYRNDPTFLNLSKRLVTVDEHINRLQDFDPRAEQVGANPRDTIVAAIREEIRSAEEVSKELLDQLRKSMPEHQQYVTLQDEREQLMKRIGDMKTKISEFDTLAKSLSPPVTIPTNVSEPELPVRPKRVLNLLAGLIVSFGLGIALVCALEHVDHSVKVPEHLTIGLALPLLGVVPRIRRTALTHRGGHLWTPGVPDSVEADAYRNLRAGLLGASDRLGPIGTLLVTSAKAGEGKSTTALNLAATCARAGERTLLMDVDLRRPSLREVFDATDDDNDLGLVDVLRGELPWQRTVVHTDLPNLDFLPTGNARAIPIEILGTLELRQLLIGLANHYDRVILDGPAVLGLADCRMLGRVVDAAVLVVRSGTHEMRPIQRAKAMLEQSRVVLAGVVFNGLNDDLENWSSYGPNPAEDLYYRSTPAERLEREEAHALPMA